MAEDKKGTNEEKLRERIAELEKEKKELADVACNYSKQYFQIADKLATIEKGVEKMFSDAKKEWTSQGRKHGSYCACLLCLIEPEVLALFKEVKP